jgi:ribonuclease P protein component
VKQAFGKSLRLLSSSDFQSVFDGATARISHQHFLILARENRFDRPRLGLVIAKKHIRLAVARNRIKRLIRESFRLQQQTLTGIDVIVLARKGMDGLENPTITKQLNQQWQRVLRKLRRPEEHAQQDPR